ncbi:hypothetical protein G7Y89_g4231 [Cudoniella acicularis]|uniref:SH3 domain-containing protein n=1 Tax=Cudoniella acicularis TaxID=354080 RepID=A0A8H4W6X0_9HELO|nr:hypothetical protein G7Y89_g4231 [Cudoniella acicularis]
MATHEQLHRRHRRAAAPVAAPEALPIALAEALPAPAQTLVSVVYVTASPTFSGPIGGYTTIGVVGSSSTSSPKAVTPTSSASSPADVVQSSSKADASSSSTLPTAITNPSTTLGNSLSVIAATSALSTASTTPTLALTTTAAAAASATSTPQTTSDGGMSTAGKAGLAIGILLLVGAILSMVLYCFRRRKEAQQQPIPDHEKQQQDPFSEGLARQDSTHSVQSAHSSRSTATAPRLSLRPVTQFIPNFMEKRISRGNQLMLAVAAASNEKGIQMERPMTPSDNVANPFGNHAEPADAAKDPSPVATPVEEEDGAGLARVMRGASKRDNGPKPLDFTKGGPLLGPPSPAGTEFSATSDSVSTPTPTNTSAAIAAAGGPANSAVHRVQLDFKPSMDDELELRAGQLIRLLHEYDDGWVSLFPTLAFQFTNYTRLSVFVWTVLGKVSSPEPACLLVPLSLAHNKMGPEETLKAAQCHPLHNKDVLCPQPADP